MKINLQRNGTGFNWLSIGLEGEFLNSVLNLQVLWNKENNQQSNCTDFKAHQAKTSITVDGFELIELIIFEMVFWKDG
jgi:hypothetical protein